AMIKFAHERAPYQREHIARYFNLDGPHELTVDLSQTDGGFIRVNSIDILESTPGITVNPYPWQGSYFEGIPVTIRAVEYPGFHFVKWLGVELPDDKEVT